jgi:hypothetical protein
VLIVLDVQTQLLPNELQVARCFQAAVHAVAEINLAYLEAHPETPSLYESGVKYQLEPPSQGYESIRSIPVMLQEGGHDCASLCAFRLAELWRDELKTHGAKLSVAKIYWRNHPNGRLFHCEVRTPAGVEDPSRYLGM